MNSIFNLMRPFKGLLCLVLLALLLSAAFNSALVGLLSPLMDNVLTERPTNTPSRVEQIFGFKKHFDRIKGWVENAGIDISALEQQAKGPDLLNPVPWSIMVMIIFVLQAFFDYLGTYTMGRVGLKVVVSLRQRLIDNVMAMSMSFYKQFNTGEILTRINSDILRVQQAISIKLGEMIKEGAKSLAFFVLAFVINFKLSLTLFVLVPMVGLPIAYFTRKIRKNAARSQGYLGLLTSHLKEVLVGIRVVKSFQREDFESRKLDRENQAFARYALREMRIVALTTPIMGFIGMIVILAFVSYGSIIIQQGVTTKGDFLFYVVAVYSLYQPIKRMARSNSEIQQAVGVMPRIEELISWQSSIPEPASPQRFPGYPRIDEVSFRDVCFSYTDQAGRAEVLKKITLPVHHGDVVALVGSSGSGKSTLVSLLPRFYDVGSGAITINGLDIRQMSKSDLRALVGMVTQDTILFDDTIANNIAYGVDDVDLAAVEDAARKAYADQFIRALPQGYQTRIGESGDTLSGGQRQRICIARAILKDAPLLILDEATSALDTESEREVQYALENLMKTKTTFVIAHRLSTIRQAGDIIVLHEGEVVERGNHEGLMTRDGVYRKLILMQEGGFGTL